MGGAVAQLTTLRLLHMLQKDETKPLELNDTLRCYTFGQPAAVDEVIADDVTRRGWDKYFYCYINEGDVIPFVASLGKEVQNINLSSTSISTLTLNNNNVITTNENNLTIESTTVSSLEKDQELNSELLLENSSTTLVENNNIENIE